MNASVVIVAAGESRRMGFDKLRADLCGAPVLRRTVEAFSACPGISEIILVTAPELASELGLKMSGKISAIVPGGSARHLSVWEGIQKCQGNCIAVHDGARPLVSAEAIEKCLAAAAEYGAAALARPITETLKRAHADLTVAGDVDRSHLWAMETPQAFRAEVLREAYQKILGTGEPVTDEVSAVQRIGHAVHLIDGGAPNLKITYPADLALARLIFGAHLQGAGGEKS